jgi:aryl-alcohol dehydrogenase-like predicted oxidoreductase
VIAIAAQLDTAPARFGLAWLLAHAPNILLIPGTSNLDHLADNATSGDITLTPEMITSLDERGEVCEQ